MTPAQRRKLDDELTATTSFERRQIEAGLFHTLEIASDANIDVGELPEIYAAVRALIRSRVPRRPPRIKMRRWADHE